MKKVIYAEKFFLESGVVGPGFLTLDETRFGEFSLELPGGEIEILDYTDKWIAPGLVDTHIHGLLGYDVMDNEAAGIHAISEGLLACGVTSFLPTTLTASTEQLDSVVEMIGKMYQKVKGAKIQGIFLEGPFFTEKHKGAQNTSYFGDPSLAKLEKWQIKSEGLIKKIAIAPEREGVAEFTRFAKKLGIYVALAHSDATYQEAKTAVENGASIFVHTYNGMSPLNHREPGMVGAAMSLKNVFNELICDGHHVHPVAADILMNATGRDRIALITDCMRAGRMPDGNYQLGEFPVTVQSGVASLESGSLAGSVLQLKDAIKNVVDWGIATPFEAIQMGSSVPAKSVGIADKCGKIAYGLAADFIVLSKELELEATYLEGSLAYQIKNKKEL
ncbi:N-acetylglucosamine-6-phosphate deacetylase [Carnobacterium gallinarum]|uniref:N-acetylglucosamine-6-phosphate deacetylase n=1 Tax=Carnobacterium gallinarum TaxID=2749 RepID=UPI000554B3F4|nr:N-acetylglucosamine-6-phosphate deacetylase [Carnobacterium gallinarum]